MKFKFLFSLYALCVLMSCRSTEKPASGTASVESSYFMSQGDFLSPRTGSWTGRLIFPEQRMPDGGVWLEVYSAPKDVALPGSRVWLTLDQSDARVKDYVTRTTIDVDFATSGGRTEAALAKGDSVPARLNGLKKVSPLESLAGSRTESFASVVAGEKTVDSIEVWIHDGVFKGGKLLTRYEPVQITGKKVALVKFIGPGAGGTYRAVHYSPKGTDEFAGPEVILAAQESSLKLKLPVSTIADIEKSPLNDRGWYIFGEEVNGVFTIRALEPRGLMDPSRAEVSQAGSTYIRDENFKDEKDKKGKGWSVVIQKDNQTQLALGDRGLIISIFGGIGGPGGDKPIAIPGTPIKFFTGHFAFGVGQIVTDPFTNQPKLDIEFKQVYAHSDRAIVSGSSKWQTFSGSMERGQMYNRPMSEIFVKIPAFSQPYRFGDRVFDPMEEVNNELQVMMGRFRTGDGTGVSEVNATNSCVQDSNQAMYVAVMKMLEAIHAVPEIKTYLASHPQEADVVRLKKLEGIMKDYVDDIVAGAALRKDWKASLTSTLAIKREYPGGLEAVLNAIRIRKAVAPRWAHDNIADLLYKNGATEWFIRHDQIGGVIPDIYPMRPGFE